VDELFVDSFCSFVLVVAGFRLRLDSSLLPALDSGSCFISRLHRCDCLRCLEPFTRLTPSRAAIRCVYVLTRFVRMQLRTGILCSSTFLPGLLRGCPAGCGLPTGYVCCGTFGLLDVSSVVCVWMTLWNLLRRWVLRYRYAIFTERCAFHVEFACDFSAFILLFWTG